MISNAYIIDFFEPGQVADAYTHYFQHYAYILNTNEALRLATQVRIRFNLPDGHGTTVMARVVSSLPDGGYGLQLSDNAPTQWLIERSREYARRLERVRPKPTVEPTPHEPVPEPPPAPPVAPSTEIGTTRPITPVEVAQACESPPTADHRKGPETKPISRRRTDQAGAAVAAVSPSDPAPTAPREPTPVIPRLEEVADELGPTEMELRRRVSELDAIIASSSARPGETLQAAPPTSARPSSLPAPAEELPTASTTEASFSPAQTPTAEVSPADIASQRLQQIGALSEKQKKKLAISGGKAERAILMTDPDTSLHLWVFKNPALTEAEVVQYAANPDLAPDALNFLLQNRRWGTASAVAYELVRNPRTPPEAIPNLLTVLPRKTLESLAELPGVRHLVARQAKRILMERSQ